MEANKSLGFVFDDPDWLVKVLLGGVISALPAVNLASAGYLVATVRNVAAGKERPLPDWSAFGEYVVSGLLLGVAVLLYCLPLGLLNSINSTLNGFVGIDYIGYAISGLIMTLSCLQSLYALLLGLWLPAAIARFAATGEFSAFFRLREIWGLISRNASDYAVAIVVAVAAGIIATLAGLALCVIGVIFTSFVAALVLAHLLGQILKRDASAMSPAALDVRE